MNDADKEPGLDFKSIGYYIIISVPVVLTIVGVIYCMCQTNCEVQQTCCKCFFNLEKEEENPDYTIIESTTMKEREGRM